jgi:hypothetical protein
VDTLGGEAGPFWKEASGAKTPKATKAISFHKL